MKLSQTLVQTEPFSSIADLLSPPFATMTAAELLAYFHARPQVHYFALRDAEQASPAQIAAILDDHFTYNDETYHLPPGFDWTANPSADREWLILLHKFYFAPGLAEEYINSGDARYVAKWLALTEVWIDSVTLDFFPSDVTGRRVQNWIFAHHTFVTQTQPAVTPAFYAKFLRSLHAQVADMRSSWRRWSSLNLSRRHVGCNWPAMS